MVVQTCLFVALLGAVLFASAGDWRWSEAWIYLGEMLAFSLALGFWLSGYDRDLLASRLTSPVHRDQTAWDRVFMAIAFLAFFGWLALMGLDAGRFGWSDMPVFLELIGLILIALCMLICWRTFHANTFAAPQVRLQSRRGHQVVTSGPYRLVRHPMYAGVLLYFLGVPLLLGSWCGFVLFPIFAIGLGIRALGEERLLRSRLTDYDIYTRRVRFRFVPYIW